MMGAIQSPARLGTLTACETSLLVALNRLPTERRHTLRLEPSGGDNVISAAFLRWLLLEAIPALRFPAFRVELRNLTIEGLLDLSRATLALVPCFRNCRFNAGLDLTEAQTRSFEVIGGSAAFVHANRMNADGALLLRAALENPAGGGDQVPRGRLIIREDVRLSGARIRGNVDFRGCWIGRAASPGRRGIALRADGLEVGGTVLLSSGFRTTGQVSLNGARIARNLNCSGGALWNPGGYSLSAAGAHIEGSLYTRTAAARGGTPVRFLSYGAFRLEGARIVGDWKAGDAHFVAPATRRQGRALTDSNILELRAIMANGLTVHASVIFNAACTIQGTAELINAKIGGDLNCNGAIFDFPGEEVLYADGITISGALFLAEARISGLFRLVQATITQGFFANKTVFNLGGPFRDLLGDRNVSAEELGLDVCGIYAPAVKVGGPFYWRRIEKRPDPAGHRRLLLSVLDADAESVEDDRQSWELLDQIDVRNCRYQSIAELTGDTMWRAELLDRAYAPLNQLPNDRAARRSPMQKKLVAFRRSVTILLQGRRRRPNGLMDYAILTFAPHPYMQLARVVHRTGYEAVANDIMVRMERNRTRYSGFGFWRQLGRWVSDGLVRYGFSPLRPVWFLIGWTVVSAVVFEYAFANHRMVPTFENLEKYAVNWTPGEERYGFNPVIYALDTLVPLIDLNQKKNWHVEPLLQIDQRDASSRAEAMRRQPTSLLAAVLRLRYSLPNDPIGWLVLFNTFFGWVLTTFLAAGVTGVLRSKPANEGGGDREQE